MFGDIGEWFNSEWPHLGDCICLPASEGGPCLLITPESMLLHPGGAIHLLQGIPGELAGH